MRAFFALDVDPAIQCAIEKWRDRTMLPAGRAVPAANFHITLHFLGGIDARQADRLCAEAGQINAAEFALRLDRPGYFPAAGVFWIGPGQVPAGLTELARCLRRAGKKAGVAPPRRTFEPHLTLYRGCRARPPLPTADPDFEISCNGFALFESVTNHKGVRYELVRRWSLQAAPGCAV